MAEYLLRQRKVERHQKDWPVDRVEADDILADQMQVGRPKRLELLGRIAVAVIADAGDVVHKRVEPNIDHVLRIEIDRDAPLERRAGHAKILQAGQQEVVHHLVLPRDGLNEFRMRIDVVDQPRRILAHFEKVRFLLGGLDLAAAVRALAVHQLRHREERFARNAVHALIVALIDIALLIEALENLLHLRFVIGVGRADELVVARSHQVPDALDLARGAIHVGFRRNALGLGLVLDLLAVLVRAGLEEDIIALIAFIPRDGVRQYRLIGVADMRLAGSVSDCRGDVIFLSHRSSPY